VKILFADQFSELGGAQLCLLDLLEEVQRRGWQAHIVAPGNGPLRRACEERNVAFSSSPSAAKSFCPDLIYVNGPRVLPSATVASWRDRTPIIFHAHSYPGRGYARFIARRCIGLRRMRVLAISRFVAGWTKSGARIIYNGVRDQGFIARTGTTPSRIGIIGRISPEKGHLDFIRAARAVSVAHPRARFLVFGAPLFSDRTFEKRVLSAAEGLPLEFRGWMADISAGLHEIDILAVPSSPAEGATRVIPEAFSAGTPVVAYPSGGIPELISDGQTGLLTDRRDPQQLAAAINRLLDDPHLLSHLSLVGRREWEARFRLDRWQREVCDFMKETATATNATRSESRAEASGDDALRAGR
jgi:glycosyltransferase involved in cell wall biosynthesis